MRGFGRNIVKSWIVAVDSVKIGDEEIRHTRIRIADSELPDTGMLIGDDFLLSHHVYMANRQQKLYFSYNGGPVFNLQTLARQRPDQDQSHPPSSAPMPPSEPSAAEPLRPVGGTTAEDAADRQQPKDAAGLSRRGMAFAARRNYAQAIADLTRACELAPDEAEYWFQRGLARARAAPGRPVRTARRQSLNTTVRAPLSSTRSSR